MFVYPITPLPPVGTSSGCQSNSVATSCNCDPGLRRAFRQNGTQIYQPRINALVRMLGNLTPRRLKPITKRHMVTITTQRSSISTVNLNSNTLFTVPLYSC